MRFCRFGDSIGRVLLEFLLYAVLVQRDYVPTEIRADVCRLSQELYTWSAFYNVRRAANCVWVHFDTNCHSAFTLLFGTHEQKQHRRSSMAFRYRWVAVSALGLLRLRGGLQWQCSETLSGRNRAVLSLIGDDEHPWPTRS